MRKRLKFLATSGIVALTGAMVVAALVLTGGPVQARKEYRDNIRAEDLRTIRWHVECMASVDTGPLPKAPTTVPGCGAVLRMQDPYTGASYRYEVVNAQTIRLCADFELPPDRRRMGSDESVSSDPNCRDYRIAARTPAAALSDAVPPEPQGTPATE